ncbi:MAG: sigma factor-like helix-turn-helix DNA-binding protein, partial [Thermoleophilaceae bacterium]
MATFDQLSDEQRAIVELVLQQGKSYDELSDMLGMPETRVRALARGALVELAPLSARAVEEDWRGQLADYVLGQQAGPEATATRGHLRRSEAARSWTRSLLDSLEQLYPEGDLPAIPEGERGRGSRRGAGAGRA